MVKRIGSEQVKRVDSEQARGARPAQAKVAPREAMALRKPLLRPKGDGITSRKPRLPSPHDPAAGERDALTGAPSPMSLVELMRQVGPKSHQPGHGNGNGAASGVGPKSHQPGHGSGAGPAAVAVAPGGGAPAPGTTLSFSAPWTGKPWPGQPYQYTKAPTGPAAPILHVDTQEELERRTAYLKTNDSKPGSPYQLINNVPTWKGEVMSTANMHRIEADPDFQAYTNGGMEPTGAQALWQQGKALERRMVAKGVDATQGCELDLSGIVSALAAGVPMETIEKHYDMLLEKLGPRFNSMAHGSFSRLNIDWLLDGTLTQRTLENAR